jgi:signal transduction histidine kinase
LNRRATLDAARAEARAAAQMTDDVVSAVSHDLRGPLSAVLLWAGLLQSGSLSESERENAVEAIRRAAQQQSHMLSNLVDLVRLMTGKLRLNVAATEVNAVTAGAVAKARPLAQAKGVELEAGVECAATVSGDRARLEQALGQLLANAIAFTPAGGRVTVRATCGELAEIEVADTGAGFEDSHLAHLFDRFREGHRGQHGHRGFGLALVRQLVEMHGGTVHAASAGKGCGATFSVRLPLAQT